MEIQTLAMFPFLNETKKYMADYDFDIIELITDEKFRKIRARGIDRVKSALDNGIVNTGVSISDNEETISYAYARLVVSAINDSYLTTRYALGEAVKAYNSLCGKNRTFLGTVMDDMKIHHNDKYLPHFVPYLRYSKRLKDNEWKMVNREVKGGFVKLSSNEIARLLQNAIQDKITSELPIAIPKDIADMIVGDCEDIISVLNAKKATFATEIKGELNIKALPECVKHLVGECMNGVNLSHSGRFAMVAFLINAGMSESDVCAIFAKSPDYDERITSYQVNDIAKKGYKAPSCEYMRSNGHCCKNVICDVLEPKNTIYVYNKKCGNVGQRE